MTSNTYEHRAGGGEFIILLPIIATEQYVTEISSNIDFSIYSKHIETSHELTKRVNAVMYHSKRYKQKKDTGLFGITNEPQDGEFLLFILVSFFTVLSYG